MLAYLYKKTHAEFREQLAELCYVLTFYHLDLRDKAQFVKFSASTLTGQDIADSWMFFVNWFYALLRNRLQYRTFEVQCFHLFPKSTIRVEESMPSTRTSRQKEIQLNGAAFLEAWQFLKKQNKEL